MTGDVIDRLRNRAAGRAVAIRLPVRPPRALEPEFALPPRLARVLRSILRWTILAGTSAYVTVFVVVFLRFGSYHTHPAHWPSLVWEVRAGLTGPAALWFLGLFAWSAKEYSGMYGAVMGLLMMLGVWLLPPLV